MMVFPNWLHWFWRTLVNFIIAITILSPVTLSLEQSGPTTTNVRIKTLDRDGLWHKRYFHDEASEWPAIRNSKSVKMPKPEVIERGPKLTIVTPSTTIAVSSSSRSFSHGLGRATPLKVQLPPLSGLGQEVRKVSHSVSVVSVKYSSSSSHNPNQEQTEAKAKKNGDKDEVELKGITTEKILSMTVKAKSDLVANNLDLATDSLDLLRKETSDDGKTKSANRPNDEFLEKSEPRPLQQSSSLKDQLKETNPEVVTNVSRPKDEGQKVEDQEKRESQLKGQQESSSTDDYRDGKLLRLPRPSLNPKFNIPLSVEVEADNAAAVSTKSAASESGNLHSGGTEAERIQSTGPDRLSTTVKPTVTTQRSEAANEATVVTKRDNDLQELVTTSALPSKEESDKSWAAENFSSINVRTTTKTSEINDGLSTTGSTAFPDGLTTTSPFLSITVKNEIMPEVDGAGIRLDTSQFEEVPDDGTEKTFYDDYSHSDFLSPDSNNIDTMMDPRYDHDEYVDEFMAAAASSRENTVESINRVQDVIADDAKSLDVERRTKKPHIDVTAVVGISVGAFLFILLGTCKYSRSSTDLVHQNENFP